MTEQIPPQDPTEDQLRAWTDRLNQRTFDLASRTPEDLQLGDLSHAYETMDGLLANPSTQFGESTILLMHELLAPHIPQMGSMAGRYFTAPRRIQSAIPRSEILPFVEGQEKIRAMRKFGLKYGQYMDVTNKTDPIIIIGYAADVITGMSDIHPFFDGNSRLGRLLADSIFLRHKMHQIPLWSDPTMGGREAKATFYRLVEQSRRGIPEPLMTILAAEQINASFAEINAIAQDPRVGEMPEAKGAIDYQEEIIKELSEFLERVS